MAMKAATFSLPKPLQLPLSSEDLATIYAYLNRRTPEEILQWALEYLPGLYQTTAFGLTGLVAIDMLSKFSNAAPPLIFIDTLYHFPETYELVEEVKKKYGVPVHVFRPEGCETVKDFEAKYGEKLWETDEDTYDFVVKVRIFLLRVALRTSSAFRLSLQEGHMKLLASRLSSPGVVRRKAATVRHCGPLKSIPLASSN